MKKIDFNDSNFEGFSDNEQILVDTGILLALSNEFDAWHNTVRHLFEKHVLSTNEEDKEKPLFLFVNPTIINELTYLADRPFQNYVKKHPEEDLSKKDPQKVVDDIVYNVKKLIENDILLVIDGNKDTVKKQIELYKKLGSADAVNVSIANEHGLNFLTVDTTLANNIERNKQQLPNLEIVYFTTPRYRSY